MKIESQAASDATLTFTAAELRILNNAMNEALEALAADADEFSTRMGASVGEVEALLVAVNAVVRHLN
ncbi:MAG: hypothetical protein JNL34_09295 [Anaerolineae bacterium]|nr:hypothetical protein [Anaerolineae bacterium]